MINTPNYIPGETKIRDPEGVLRGGGVDRDVPESEQNWLVSHTNFTL
jgi:hypothetical protein